MDKISSARILAVIPARGGHGLASKNLRQVGGKSLLAWTLETAASCRHLFARSVVSTDDPEIARAAKSLGIETPFRRPAELAAADVPIVPVLQHALHQIESQEGAPFDWICWLSPTCPLRRSSDLEAAVALALEGGCDSVISVAAKADGFASRLRRIEGERFLPFFRAPNGGEPDPRAFPPAFQRNGAIFLVRREVLMVQGSLWGEVIRPLLMPAERSPEITGDLDFLRADLLLSASVKQRGLAPASALTSTNPAQPSAIPPAPLPLSPGSPPELRAATPDVALGDAATPGAASLATVNLPPALPANPAPERPASDQQVKAKPASAAEPKFVPPTEYPAPTDSTRWLYFLACAQILLCLPLLWYNWKLSHDQVPVQELGQYPWRYFSFHKSLVLILSGSLILELAAWTYAMYQNLSRLAHFPSSTPGRVTAFLVLPLFNLVTPLRTFMELWRGSDPSAEAISGLLNPKRQPIPILLPIIFACYFAFASLAIYQRCHQVYQAVRQGYGSWFSFHYFTTYSLAAFIFAAVGILLLVRPLENRQRRRWEYLRSLGKLPLIPPASARSSLGPRHAWRAFFLLQLAQFGLIIVLQLRSDSAFTPYYGQAAIFLILVTYALPRRRDWTSQKAIMPTFGHLLALFAMGTIAFFTLWVFTAPQTFSSSRELTISPYLALALAPVLEEIFFRGFLFEAFAKHFSKVSSAFFSALLFSAIHLNPIQSLHTLGLGFLCGMAKAGLGSVWAPILVHVTNNLIPLMVDRQMIVSNRASGLGGVALAVAGALYLILKSEAWRTFATVAPEKSR